MRYAERQFHAKLPPVGMATPAKALLNASVLSIFRLLSDGCPDPGLRASGRVGILVFM